jgi:hypothetical protein
MSYQIQKTKVLEWTLIFLALTIPLIFFASLEWNPEKSAQVYMDKFFGADVWRVLENLKDSTDVSHYRDNVHPYFSLFAVTVAKFGGLIFGNGFEFDTYKIFFGTLGTFLFWLYLYKETNALSAFAAMGLLLSTMTVRVWSTLPETYLFGFFTLMLALNAARININPIFVGVATLAGTITNVFFGLLYAYKKFNVSRQFFSFILLSAVACLILSFLQKYMYPSSVHFYDLLHLKKETLYAELYVKKTIYDIPFRVFDFLFSGFVLPIQAGQSLPVMSKRVWLTFFEGETIGLRLMIAVYASLTLALFLIATSTYKLLKTPPSNTCGFLIFGFLCFQLLLHCTYGDTPFLYSYHFTPFLILLITQFQPGVLEKTTPFLLIVLAVAIQVVNLSNYDTFKLLFL